MALAQEYLEAQLVSNGFDTAEKQKAVVGEDLKKYKTSALKLAKSAYLGRLFLMMSDKRYKPMKKFMHEGVLAENQQYARTCCS